MFQSPFQILATEIFKVKNDLSPEIVTDAYFTIDRDSVQFAIS